jgi:Glycosyl transferase family 2.
LDFRTEIDGVVEAVNNGFAMAKGDICAIQSSDDLYLSGAVERAVRELVDNPALGLVFGDIIKIDADGNERMRSIMKPFSLEKVLSVRTWIPQPGGFFRLSLAEKLGGWRESVPYAADTDMWMRILLKADAKKIDVFMAKRRIHPNQRDIHGDRIIRDYSQMIKDLFDIYNAPSHLRPAADAGVLMMTNRYNYDEGEKVKIQRLRKALKLYPPLKDQLILPSRIPGVECVRSFARRVRGKAVNQG